MMFVYLGISSISPVVGETLQEVYSKLQELGGFLSDECQASKQIVSFMGDKLSQHSEAAKNIFSKFKTGKGDKKDLSNAYKEYPSGKGSVLNDAVAKDERYALENINIAWKALDKLKLSNTELKELMMTISGTVIIKANDNNTPQFQYISSKVHSPGILEALLKGSKNMQMLSCNGDNAKCLNVAENNKFIEEKDSFEHKVSEYFDKFKEALEKDIELESSAQKFLGNAGIPAYTMYDVLYQYSNSHPEYEQGILVEIVAWNILYNYLADMLKEVNEAADNLQIAASSELKEFKASLKASQEMLSNFEMKDLSRYKLQLFLVNRSEKMEDAMSDDVSRIISMAKVSY
jgi:conjugative transfer pilus assembly protein TraH